MKKQLECLYAWSEFYKVNQKHADQEKIQKQITEFKEKHKLI